jgi:hypothetical protein
LKEQSQKLARKNIKGGCYLKVTLVDTGLIYLDEEIRFVLGSGIGKLRDDYFQNWQ